MKSIKRHLILGAFLVTGFAANAQTIKGSIADAGSKQGLPSATVTLSATNSTPIIKTTNDKGEFVFNSLKNGAYSLRVTFMGFKDTTIANIAVNNNTINIPTILLNSTSSSLKAVEVKTTPPLITMSGDKMTMNVAGSPAATGSTAYELIQKAPGVVIENQSNKLTLNGKPVTVYIDGRPSRLSPDDLKNQLSGMSANNIDKLEIMSNPSVKYDAQDGAIINIKFVKNKNFGTNGTLTLGGGAGVFPRGNGGITLNNRNKKVNIYGGYDYLYTKTRNNAISDRYFTNNYVIHDVNPVDEKAQTHNVKVGVDYDLNSKNSFGVLLKGSFSDRDRLNENMTYLGFQGKQTDSTLSQINTGDVRTFNPSANAYYKYANALKRKEFTINFDYFNFNKDWYDGFNTAYFLPNSTSPFRQDALRNNSLSNINLYSLSADYERTTKFAKWEGGVKSTYTQTDNDLNWELLNTGKWENDVSKTNHFIYKENVNAAYLQGSKSIKKLALTAALRLEHTYAKGDLRATENSAASSFDRNYLQLFPSVNVNYNKDMAHIYSFSYRRSIQRFGYDIVNPFINYKNAYTYSQGNPNIKPMDLHAMEAGFIYKYTFITKVGWVHSGNALTMVYKQDEEKKTLVTTYDNLGKFNVAYASMVFTKMLYKKWQTMTMLNGLYFNVKDGSQGGFETNSFALMFNSTNTITLPKKFVLEVTGSASTPMVMGVTNIGAMASLDLGVKKTILKDKGSLKLGVTDIFHSRKVDYKVDYQNILNKVHSIPDSRVVNLTFNYSFGNKNVKQTKTRKSSIESENSRTNASGL
ncbi:carboxypeptidase-like protein [Chitinophaga skermanii]|uniref:Carboxypeptidase-like protein n=1 Tax=Chitinophaga skermanii TaxID=331697 RepID=A0A327R4C9_9BACT|nr:outer membrane beta-barrel protein [Chitinophaga skermanii]RAJ11065.1 carboxypeptidase-like protein [Chitinophaga skermanii]